MTAIEFRSKGASYKLIEFIRLSIRRSSILEGLKNSMNFYGRKQSSDSISQRFWC